MTKLNENSVKNHIDVNGLILTPEAIARLKQLQLHDNDELNCNIDIIAEAICFIGSTFHNLSHNEDRENAAQVIADLSSVRDDFKKIRKP